MISFQATKWIFGFSVFLLFGVCLLGISVYLKFVFSKGGSGGWGLGLDLEIYESTPLEYYFLTSSLFPVVICRRRIFLKLKRYFDEN